ncbi:Rib/alpha-like domain-containing protein, partial [Streptococcus infantis]|uniref:Rib/alpha-like domain-containing protein n=1 Tax=Streptococcus infantis TaxID=68892 RepID=UPI0039C03F3D
VNVGETPDPKGSIDKVGDLPEGTKVEYKTPVDTTTPGDKETTVVVTYPDGSKDEVPATVKVVDPRTDAEKNNPKPKDQTVNVGETPDPKGSIDKVGDLPEGTKVEYKTPVDTTTPGDKETTAVVTYPDGSKDEVPVTVKVVDPRTDAEKNNPTPKDQTVNVGETPDPKKSIGNVGDLPSGTTVEYKTPVDTTTPGDKETTAVVTYPDGSKDEVPVTVTVTTPAQKTPTVDVEQDPETGEVTVTPKKPDGTPYKPGTKVEIPGENGTTIPVTIGDNGSGKVPNDKLPKTDVPGKGTVTEPNKKPSQPVDVTTPARKTPTLDVERNPETGEVTVTPKKPDGTPYKPGTKVEIPGEDGPITVEIGEDGKGKVPNDKLPKKDVPGTAKITEPGQPTVEVPVTTPAKVTPETSETEKPGKIEITQQPNGNAIVTPKKPDGSTYPSKTKVEIPGENGTTITVTIGDNGSGEVPNDKLPKKDVPGTGTVTEPNKKPSQPVDVTTPARKTPTVELDKDPKTGDVTVTPKKPDGSTFPPGTKVEIPGEDGPIIVEIGQDGKGKVPNDKLPKKDVPGTGKITEPGKPAVEVPVTTPGKVTPNTPTTEKPGKIEITRKPNGDAVVTPKKPDGSTYPSGSKVVIPGENNTPIEVTIGDNGSGEVPNDKLPKKDVPGTGTVTEPNKKPSQPVDVTTPGQKTPTVDVEQDPKTGDVTVTPKKPDGSTFPPGTKVEIPGKDGNPITVTIGEDGKGKVPNSDLPEGDVPGTGKITEPGKPAVEVPVETPGKVTPVAVNPNVNHEDTTATIDNGAKSNDSQKVLPNTGTESNATLASLGLLGILGGLGLALGKKKED